MSAHDRLVRPESRIIGSSWQLLRRDRQLLWLPFLSVATGACAAALLFVPGFAIGDLLGGRRQVGGYVGGVFAVFAFSVVSIFFQAALVMAAFERADGATPSIGGVLARAWASRRKILAWALVSTTVGALMRALEERLGILGKLIGLLGGLAWAVASFLAVPVIVAEDLGPIAAIKRSSGLIRHTWGTGLRTTVRIGAGTLVLTLPLFALTIAGIGTLLTGSAPVGVVLIVVGAGGLIALFALVSAVSTYSQALIYRFATGRPVPGIPDHQFAGAFVTGRRRWRRR